MTSGSLAFMCKQRCKDYSRLVKEAAELSALHL